MSRRLYMTSVFLAAASLALASPAIAAPSLEFVPGELDVGERGPAETVEASVEIRNVGDAKARVFSVRACCGAKASVSAMEIGPSGSAELSVSLVAGARPGPFRKTVTVRSDDPKRPLFVLPVVGSVRGTSLAEVPGGVEFVDASSPPSVSKPRPAEPRLAFLPLTLPAVLVAGFVDGFNPCAFSIVIVLAGILAAGGRRRRAQMLGGWSFCAASFLTYMAMGLGLLRAMDALSRFARFRDLALAALSCTLFVLAFLSLRDALRYHRARVPSVITLQLPDRVKKMIRAVAEASWSGPAVVVAGFGCGFVVTLLDSLCTGQVYVPVLAMLAVERVSSRALALLAVYNLAFIAPLVAVFMFSAYGVGSERMRSWSRNNVVPSKVALAVVFAMLGLLLWPGLVMDGTAALREANGADVASTSAKASSTGSVRLPSGASPRADTHGGRMSPAELAEGNERLNAALAEPTLGPGFSRSLAGTVRDRGRDVQWRNHCLQVVPECMMRLDAGSEERAMLASVLSEALSERRTVLAGTALLGYARLSEATGSPTAEELDGMAVSMASDASTSPENVVTALRLGAERGCTAMLAAARYWARRGEGGFVRCVAISAVRDLGGPDDVDFLRSLLPARSKAEDASLKDALKRLEAKR